MTASVSLTPLFRCFSSKSMLLTDPKSMQSCLSLILRFSFKSLLLIKLTETLREMYEKPSERACQSQAMI